MKSTLNLFDLIASAVGSATSSLAGFGPVLTCCFLGQVVGTVSLADEVAETPPIFLNYEEEKYPSGDIVVDRSGHSLPFEIHIKSYEDEDGQKHRGPWKWTYGDLGSKWDKDSSKAISYLTIRGDGRLNAHGVWFDIVTKYGKTVGVVGAPINLNRKGELVITVDEANAPALPVPESVMRKDRELVMLLMHSESTNDSERMYWISKFSMMTEEQRVHLKEVLKKEYREVREIRERDGTQPDEEPRPFDVVSDKSFERLVAEYRPTFSKK